MSNKKMGKFISYVGIVFALLVVLLMPSSVAAEGGSVDCTVSGVLTISEVSVSSIGYYAAIISWNTNGEANSQVSYDTVYHEDIDDYAYSTEETALVSGHSIPLTGLSSGTTYHYRVRSAIPDTEFVAISEDYTFKTSSRAPSGPTTYYTKTNLFGVEESFRISRTGEILKTVEATSEDGMLTMTIPEGTIALDKYSKRLASLETAVDESPPDPPEDAYIIGLAYDFDPAGATFDPPLTLEYTYDPDTLPEGVAEEDLVIAYYDEATGEWVELDCVVDTVNNTITASVPHFTTFAIIGRVPAPAPPEPAPARFTISSLGVSPSELAPGEEVNISVLVANTGGEAGSYQVTLVINDLVEATKEVTVRAGLSKEVTFSVTKEEADTYAVTVDGLSDSFMVVSVVVPPEPAAFSVSYLSGPRLEVEPGESVTITVLVANIGGESGSYTVVLKVDGVKEAEERVTIAAGESQDVSFSVTREEAGSYTVAVDGWSGSFTVVAVVVPPAPPGINWPLIGGIIGGVIVVGLVIYFLVVRRRAAWLLEKLGTKGG